MQIRDVIWAEDYGQVATWIAAASGRAVTAADLVAEFADGPAGQVLRERVCVAADGGRTGYSRVYRLPWWGAGRFHIWVAVDEAWRGRGCGSALYTDALAFAAAAGATRIESDLSDGDGAARRFAEQRGFELDRHLFNSWLDVPAFDPEPFAGVVDAVRAQGIRFCTMRDAGDTPENQRRMYEVNRAAALDIPGREPTFSDFDQYLRRHLAHYRPELHWIATDGDHWVGLAALVMQGDALHNRMTGVVATHRGRRIALALKLLAIETARSQGIARMTTNNDSENQPMLAINRKLGYQPMPGVYLMVRR